MNHADLEQPPKSCSESQETFVARSKNLLTFSRAFSILFANCAAHVVRKLNATLISHTHLEKFESFSGH